MLTDLVILPETSAIAGLTFRGFKGEADYPKMVAVVNGSREADEIDELETLANLTNAYAHLVNSNPYADMLFAEVEGQVVGYARVSWREALDGSRLYEHLSFLLPQWRGRGVEREMLRFCEQRLHEIAAQHSTEQPRFLQAAVFEGESGKRQLLESAGYAPARYFYEMVRPDLENIPEAPLPPGLEVRPAQPEHYRLIWEALIEAFQDHWGNVSRGEEDYQTWLGGDEFQPHLWQVAWDTATNQVAGMVLSCIFEEENARLHRRQGWMEDICVRRPWRCRGLARALIAESLRDLRARGMTKAALGVDTENTTGALRLYERMGFRPAKRHAFYRKPMP
jgi:ribosomal protein S18 acetylase RimI-like enzyme